MCGDSIKLATFNFGIFAESFFIYYFPFCVFLKNVSQSCNERLVDGADGSKSEPTGK